MILDRARTDLRLGAAEVADQDSLTWLTLGFSTVGAERTQVQHALEGAVDLVDRLVIGEIVEDEIEFMDFRGKRRRGPFDGAG